jgi:signal peptidase II
MVLADQLMKNYAVLHWKGLPHYRSFFFDIFRIQYAENHGAFLSLFANLPDEVRFWVLTVFNGIILLGVSGYVLLNKSVSRYVFFAFTFVVAGGMGNMIDRMRFNFVIDFFNMGLGGLRTGIFNIADMAISAGFIMMIPLALYGETSLKPDPAAEKLDAVTGSATS